MNMNVTESEVNDKDTAAWENVIHINSIQVSFSAGRDHFCLDKCYDQSI